MSKLTEDQKNCPYCNEPFRPLKTLLIEQTRSFPKENERKHGRFVTEFLDTYAFVAGGALVTTFKDDKYYTLDIRISYCPFCGRKLFNDSEIWEIPGDKKDENFEED